MDRAQSINPATGKLLATFPFADPTDREFLLARAHKGFGAWRAASVVDRVAVVASLGAILASRADMLARSITKEMGKPIAQARAEVMKCAALCRYYADHAEAMLEAEICDPPSGTAEVHYRPLGLVLAVMPWNFPLWQVLRAAVPIMLVGNALVLKHAPNVLQSAYALKDAFLEAGAPEGVFSVLNIAAEDTAAVLADDRVAAVTLTGSVRAGRAVAGLAAANLKKSLLELGGSDPFVVLADADLDAAVAAAIQSRYLNCGQVCIAAKRIIVESPVMAAFTERFVEAARALPLGDPLDEATFLGPMARRDLRAELDGQLHRSVDAGARLLLGGCVVGAAEGAFYEASVLAGVEPGMAAFDEETFGPLAALIEATDAEEAVALANRSAFGLSAALWTADENRAAGIAARLEVGGVFVNGFSASDPRVPIGGVKLSGYGRELSHFGLREFANAQLVWSGRA